MKREEWYKIEGRPCEKGIEKLRKKYCSNKNCTCNQLQKIYIRTNLLELCREPFSLEKISLTLPYCHLFRSTIIATQLIIA